MMQGNKWRLFCLQLSFLGWILLTIFTCGIGMIVLNPYMEAAMAAFYREVSGTYQQNNQSSYYGGYQQNQNGQNQYQQDQYSGNQYQQNQYQQNQYQQNQYQQPQHVVDPFQQQYSSNQFQQEPYDFAQHHGSDEQHNDFDQMDIDSNAGDMHEADLHEMDQPDMDIDMSTDSTGDQSND